MMKKATVKKATSKKTDRSADKAEVLVNEASMGEDLNEWLHSHEQLDFDLKGSLKLFFIELLLGILVIIEL